MAHKIKGGHLVYDAHEFFTEVPELSRRPFSKWIWSMLEKILLPGIRNCYTVSPGVAFLFQKKYKKQFDLVRNVPYRLDFPIENKQESRIIIYQGALNIGRGLEMAIRAMRHVDGELYLAGEGDLSKELRAMVLQLKLTEKVKFLGNVSPEKLPSITRKAIIGLNLLENRGLNYYYSLANKFFDYIEAGIPQISMRFPDYDKINQEYEIALLMEGLNELVLAKAIQQLLDDNELYDKLKNNTINAREDLCWQNEEKTLLRIFSKLT
jgi:glycosyltransferase involved in cell wall biosynthesis